MFSPFAMLWEQDWPRVRVGVHDDDGAASARADGVAGTERGDCADESLNRRRLALVQ
jgi:hypothetical protein